MGTAWPPGRRESAPRLRRHPGEPAVKIRPGASPPPEGPPGFGGLEGRAAGAMAVRSDRRRADLVRDRSRAADRLDYPRRHRASQGPAKAPYGARRLEGG